MGKINIKEQNRNKFTAYAREHGMTVSKMANTILRNREKYSPAMIKRAAYALKASKWSEGGLMGNGKRTVYFPGADEQYDKNLSFNRGWQDTLTKGKTIEDVDNSVIGSWNSKPMTMGQFNAFPQRVRNTFNSDFSYEKQKMRLGLPNTWADMNMKPSPGGIGGEDMYIPSSPAKNAGNNIAYIGPTKPEFSTGGTLTSVGTGALSGAATGFTIGGPYGAAAGAVIGGASGLISGMAKTKEEEMLEANKLQGMYAATDASQAGILNNYPPTFRTGGQFKGKKFGGIPNAIVGGGEVVITPDGMPTNMKGPSDMNGGKGMPVQMPDNTMIISKRNSKDILPLTNKINKSNDVIEGSSTQLAKNTAKKNLNKYYSRVLDVYNRQEAKKGNSGDMMNQFDGGGSFTAGDYQTRQGNNLVDTDYLYGNPSTNSSPFVFNDYGISAGNKVSNADGTGGPTNWGNVASGIGEMAPMLYNIGQGLFGKREYQNADDYRNPYEGSINSLMSNRRYNIDAGLASNEAAFRTTSANMRNLGGSRGQVMSNLTGAQNTKQFADMALYGQQSNVNNQYRGEQANMQYGLGRDVSMTKMSVDESNAMTRATGRNFTGAAMTGLQQYLLTRRQMKGQASRDKMLADAIKGYSPYSSKWIPGLGN